MLCGVPPFYSKDRETLYRNIKYAHPKLDQPFLSESARDFLSKILVKDPSQRLGSGFGGMQALKDHPWFDCVNWSHIYHKMEVPPYKPQLESSTDTRHFPKEFTQMVMSPEGASSLKDSLGSEPGWKGFSFHEDDYSKIGMDNFTYSTK
jgi:serine/threonine protein kinase